MGMFVVMAGYLSDVQICEPPEVPRRPVFVTRTRGSGAPIFTIHMDDATGLGAEFFRWEVATAACGWLMRINPFDEPNVQQAKDATRALLDSYTTPRQLPLPEPPASRDGVRLTLSSAAESALGCSANARRISGRAGARASASP